MRKPSLILIGNGMAGVRTLEELLKRAPNQYDINVFGAEPHGNYNRIALSPVLAGEKTLSQIITHPPEWYAAQSITLSTGDAVTAIQRAEQTITTASGRSARYDKLLIATGSAPLRLPVPGNDLPGVMGFRYMADVQRMITACAQHRHAVVIGGGLLGLEAANGLASRGMAVTVVHQAATLMNRQLDAAAAVLLQMSLEARGLQFRLQANTVELIGGPCLASSAPRVQAVRLASGELLAADLVVMAAGIVPNTALAEAAGLACERGIVVDDSLRTSDPNIYAVGECAQHRGQCYGLVAPLWEQAIVCAQHLAGPPRYTGSITSTKLKVTGVDLFSAGNFEGGEGSESLVLRDPRRGVYKKLVLRDGRLEGAVLVGDLRDSGWYLELIQQRTPVAQWRQKLVFGQSYCEAPATKAA